MSQVVPSIILENGNRQRFPIHVADCLYIKLNTFAFVAYTNKSAPKKAVKWSRIRCFEMIEHYNPIVPGGDHWQVD